MHLNHALEIKDVCQEDSGLYTVVLKNSAASLERRLNITLIVNGNQTVGLFIPSGNHTRCFVQKTVDVQQLTILLQTSRGLGFQEGHGEHVFLQLHFELLTLSYSSVCKVPYKKRLIQFISALLVATILKSQVCCDMSTHTCLSQHLTVFPVSYAVVPPTQPYHPMKPSQKTPPHCNKAFVWCQ